MNEIGGISALKMWVGYRMGENAARFNHDPLKQGKKHLLTLCVDLHHSAFWPVQRSVKKSECAFSAVDES